MKNCTFLLLLLFVMALFSCRNQDAAYFDPRGTDYAGAQSCVQCHTPEHKSAVVNAHFNSTALADGENVLGEFDSGNCEFAYDAHTKLVMQKRKDGYYQVVYKDGKELEAHRFDVLFGSKNAQTSGYFKDGQSYELPVSYYRSADAWGSSPGFPAERPFFGRVLEKDCYACHASNANTRRVTTSSTNKSITSVDIGNFINPQTMVYGIDCERCHGPAKQHVVHHLKFPSETKAFGMASFKSLSNQQKNDACAICHSGVAGMRLKSRFDFKPGDNVLDYYRPTPTDQSSEHDVHGNQAQMLAQSKCFVKSQALNCTTCHDSHEQQARTAAGFTAICTNCHPKPAHANMEITQHELETRCIDCHMPKQASKAISFRLSGSKDVKSYELRTHKIAVYAEPNRAK